jgi:hypothetical protein
MLETFVYCDSLFNIYRKHLVDQIQSWVPNAVPVRTWVIKSSRSDLLAKRVRVLGGVKLVAERWETAQADVQNDAQRPYIDSSCVPATVALFQDLGRNI